MTAAITGNEISVFFIVLARVSGLILSAPVLSSTQVPRVVKVLLAIMLSIVLTQLPHIAGAHVPTALMPFGVAVVTQLIIGIALGFLAQALFFAVQVAGQIVSLQIGLGNAAVFNPTSGQPDPIVSQLYSIIASLVFLAVNGDLWLVASLSRSFDLAPIGAGGVSSLLVNSVISSILAVTGMGLQISLPIAASLLASNVVLGVVGRSMPQLNLFVLSMPLDLILGLIALIGSLAALIYFVGQLTGQLPHMMLTPLGARG